MKLSDEAEQDGFVGKRCGDVSEPPDRTRRHPPAADGAHCAGPPEPPAAPTTPESVADRAGECSLPGRRTVKENNRAKKKHIRETPTGRRGVPFVTVTPSDLGCKAPPSLPERPSSLGQRQPWDSFLRAHFRNLHEQKLFRWRLNTRCWSEPLQNEPLAQSLGVTAR